MNEQNEQRKLSEINRPMNEELFNNLEKQYQELAKVKAETEQIEEIARITKAHCELDNQCGSCHWETCNDCFAEILYNAGYRKQCEGEWLWKSNGYKNALHCSLCNKTAEFHHKFCPNCGAKMKG